MDLEWCAKMLAASDVHSHARAAVFLSKHGSSAYPYVETTLARCKVLDLTRSSFGKYEDILLLCGTRAIAQIVRAVGYRCDEPLHCDVLSWIEGLTRFQTARVRNAGLWGLGDLGTPPESVLRRLIELIDGKLLDDEDETITCRGQAFRMLARVSRRAASERVDTPACFEYIEATKKWRADWITKYPNNTKRLSEIDAESAWLREFQA